MKKIFLNQLFEQVLSDVINTTHYLKQVVDKYKHLKVGAYPVILDSDFNDLFSENVNKYRLRQISTGMLGYMSGIPYDTPINRVYNLYQNLQLQISGKSNNLKLKLIITPEQKEFFKHAVEELKGLAKKAYDDLNKKSTVEPTTDTNDSTSNNEPIDNNNYNNNFSLSKTKFLKNLAYIRYKDGSIDYLSDNDFYVFKDDKNPNIETIYNAILNNDQGLNLQLNSPENKIYYLWKELKEECLSTMVNYVTLVNLSGGQGQNLNKNIYKKELTETSEINFNNLKNGAQIGLSYKLLSKPSNKEIENVTDGIFNYNNLRHSYQLVNNEKKYIYFAFNHKIGSTIVNGGKYYVEFWVTDQWKEFLYIIIDDLKTHQINTVAQVRECNAVDELKKLIYNIRTSE